MALAVAVGEVTKKSAEDVGAGCCMAALGTKEGTCRITINVPIRAGLPRGTTTTAIHRTEVHPVVIAVGTGSNHTSIPQATAYHEVVAMARRAAVIPLMGRTILPAAEVHPHTAATAVMVITVLRRLSLLTIMAGMAGMVDKEADEAAGKADTSLVEAATVGRNTAAGRRGDAISLRSVVPRNCSHRVIS
jgi:hypothetical protein